MKKMRTLHLWIGLICSIFILLQSITGILLLNERLFMGDRVGGEPPDFVQMQQQQSPDASGAERTNFRGGFPVGPDGGEVGGGALGFIKNLHKGIIGGTNISVLLNITAIGMIALTLTGIMLSIKTLRAQSKSRRKQRQAESAT
ncbi:PepSY-associated TM helix domain-containing protein [Paenibacillus sp. D2_2]|uniref:PepSY-associated TM helix domain-containing protein n=1 Tax=Paenibacillus sp. D2_2 TaxID=3073092 RepID=UPI002814A153|nr:PepSY-associated TM helix domain-containing protein [Paenibacillus sp. D2_2]WMT41633.1 PepSY-associated TM helix domain-containing protein [Paenibacillus sp. D2_2]